jgi:polycystin 1L2
VAGNFQKRQFTLIVAEKAYRAMSDDHLWFSIFSRPPSSHFTRVQRCTCCFVLLYTAMLFNILYYDQAEEAQNGPKTDGFSLGPFYLSREQVCQLTCTFLKYLLFIRSVSE